MPWGSKLQGKREERGDTETVVIYVEGEFCGTCAVGHAGAGRLRTKGSLRSKALSEHQRGRKQNIPRRPGPGCSASLCR